MLETSEERIRLLKEGIFGKTIERLYVTYNGFRVVGEPGLLDLVRTGTQRERANLQTEVPPLFLTEFEK